MGWEWVDDGLVWGYGPWEVGPLLRGVNGKSHMVGSVLNAAGVVPGASEGQ